MFWYRMSLKNWWSKQLIWSMWSWKHELIDKFTRSVNILGSSSLNLRNHLQELTLKSLQRISKRFSKFWLFQSNSQMKHLRKNLCIIKAGNRNERLSLRRRKLNEDKKLNSNKTNWMSQILRKKKSQIQKNENLNLSQRISTEYVIQPSHSI